MTGSDGWRAASWQDMWQGVLAELSKGDGTFAAVDGSAPAAEATVEAIEEQMPDVLQVGRHLTAGDELGDVDRLFGSLVEPTLLLDLDVLFTPRLHLNVLTLLRNAARRTPIVAVWPGAIARADAFTYSEPGRADHRSEIARGVLVIRPRSVHFPDEPPFTIERVPS